MSVTDFLIEFSRLSPEDQDLVRLRLDQLRHDEIEEAPDRLAAIDEGIHSAETEPSYPLEQVQAEIPSWLIKSS